MLLFQVFVQLIVNIFQITLFFSILRGRGICMCLNLMALAVELLNLIKSKIELPTKKISILLSTRVGISTRISIIFSLGKCIVCVCLQIYIYYLIQDLIILLQIIHKYLIKIIEKITPKNLLLYYSYKPIYKPKKFLESFQKFQQMIWAIVTNHLWEFYEQQNVTHQASGTYVVK